MSALEVIQSNLVAHAMAPLSDATGGTSKGDAGAGGDNSRSPAGVNMDDMSLKDRGGAIALTVVLILAMLGAAL